jgi:hypothetical protein
MDGLSMKSLFFFHYLSVGFYITEENPTSKSKIESTFFSFSVSNQTEIKNKIEFPFSRWGKSERVQIHPANSLSSSKNPLFFFQLPQFHSPLLAPPRIS